MSTTIREAAVKVIDGLGLPIKIKEKQFVSNAVETESCSIHGTKVKVEVADFGKTCRIDIDFSLPEEGVVARTYMEHCAQIEKTPKNHHGEYCAGPRYHSYSEELGRVKMTFAYTSWDHSFYVRSEGYGIGDLDEAVENAVSLAGQFIRHLGEFASMRFWTTEDKEVVAKAKEVVRNTDFRETDCDREEKAHWLVDRNSFIKGWFMPSNNRGKGSFDTLWPSSLDYAASSMGNKGSFEYAVACIVLEDPAFIAKAQKACRAPVQEGGCRYCLHHSGCHTARWRNGSTCDLFVFDKSKVS